MEGKQDINTLTPDDIVERINAYQRLQLFHPLTCGNDSAHDLLVAKNEGGRVVLMCPVEGCTYRQANNIPTAAYSLSVQEMEKHAKTMYGSRSP